MGMYTEFFFRAHLNPKHPEFIHLRDWLNRAINDVSYTADEPYNEHPFFSSARWTHVLYGGGAVWQISHPPRLEHGDFYTSLTLHTSLKDYSGETGLFMDFIHPFVDPPDGTFLGFTQYEDSTLPTLYFKGPDGLKVV